VQGLAPPQRRRLEKAVSDRDDDYSAPHNIYNGRAARTYSAHGECIEVVG